MREPPGNISSQKNKPIQAQTRGPRRKTPEVPANKTLDLQAVVVSGVRTKEKKEKKKKKLNHQTSEPGQPCLSKLE